MEYSQAAVIQVAVCDDEEIFRAYIRKLLAEDGIRRGYDLQVSEYGDGRELLEAHEAGRRMDILFLDIRMREQDGLETARLLRERGCGCLLIFLTSMSEYMQKGYEVRAFRFLLKEQAAEELPRVMQDCRRELSAEGYFSFTSEHRSYLLPKTDILYFESCKRLILLHTAREVFRFYGKLDDLEAELSAEGFLRCHRSFLVREDRVRRWQDRELTLTNDERLPVSRSYEREVNRRLMLRMG